MALRRFTERGREEYRNFLRASQDGEAGFADLERLLERDQFTEFIQGADLDDELCPEEASWGSRFAFARDCHEEWGEEFISRVLYDGCFWDWVVAKFFRVFCKTDAAGEPNVGALSTLSLKVDDWNRYYRHHAAGPIYAYHAHLENPEGTPLVALANPLDTPGELAEQFLSRHELMAFGSTLGAATLLYIDPSSEKPYTGAAGREQAGTARRYGAYIKQLELTYDLGSMSVLQLFELLPREYRRFKREFLVRAVRLREFVNGPEDVSVKEIANRTGWTAFFVQSALELVDDDSAFTGIDGLGGSAG
jgi:hypothetical protein